MLTFEEEYELLKRAFLKSKKIEDLERLYEKYPDKLNLDRSCSEIQYHLIKSLITNEDLIRKELCNQIDRPRSTIYDHLKKLLSRKIISKIDKPIGERGRPKVYWFLNEDLSNLFKE